MTKRFKNEGEDTLRSYFHKIEKLLHSCPLVISLKVQTEIIDINLGYFKARVKFVDNSELHLFEFVRMKDNEVIVEKYRYHYQDSSGRVIKRWDNAKHHPELKTFPHHVHIGKKIEESVKPEIEDVLLDVVRKIQEIYFRRNKKV